MVRQGDPRSQDRSIALRGVRRRNKPPKRGVNTEEDEILLFYGRQLAAGFTIPFHYGVKGL